MSGLIFLSRKKPVSYTHLEVTMETTFADDLGADSLDVFQIVMGIEEEFDIQIEAEEAEHIVSVEDAVEAIKKKLAE